MFGDEIGPLVGDAVRGDISWSFTENPEDMARAAADRLAGRESDILGAERTEIAGLRDLPALMQHQAEGAATGRRALRQIVERMQSGAWKPKAGSAAWSSGIPRPGARRDPSHGR